MFDAVAKALPEIRQVQFLQKNVTGSLLTMNQIKDYIVQLESA